MTPRRNEPNEEAFGSATALAGRIRPEARHVEPEQPVATASQYEAIGLVALGAAGQVEVVDGSVRFMVPFTGSLPDEYWLQAFEEAGAAWPAHLRQPKLEEVYGIAFGPLPVAALEEHVEALKQRVEAANHRYRQEVVPELLRQYEEAKRREEAARRLQEDVEDRLARLLG
jgi:hypothetical protein